MDRIIAYPDAIALETDILSTAKFAMVADGVLARAILGDGQLADGLACVPTAPASMSLIIGSGSIFSLQAVDGTAYGSLGSDTARSTIKVGHNANATIFAFTAPTTPGHSQNFLVQAAFVETDGGSSVVPYYNPDNPSQPYSGPDNSGAPQMTLRTQRVSLVLKPGASAAAGTQATAAADAGYSALWVVTVPYGATSLTSGNIAAAPNAPFIGTKLTAKANLNSPAFTGTPTGPTPPAGDDSDRLATTAFGKAAILAALAAFSALPVGLGPLPWPVSSPPSGWLLCGGQAVSRATFAALFAVLGTSYGAGNGSTTFNLPDGRGRAIFGQDGMNGAAAGRLTVGGSGIDGGIVGAVGGDEHWQAHNHGASDPSHSHSTYDPGHHHEAPYGEGGLPFDEVPNSGGSLGSGRSDTDQSRYYTSTSGTNILIDGAVTGITVSVAGIGGSGNVPPALVMNFIIFAGA